MTITTLAGLKAGLRPPILYSKNAPGGTTFRCRTHWALAGAPAAGGYDTTLNGVLCDNTTLGAIPFDNPPSGESYFAGLELAHSGANKSHQLLDRLWHNGGINITSTSPQAIASPAWDARDINGAVDGEGVLLYLEVSATCGAATPTITVSYTNSAGVSGRTAVNLEPTTSAAAASGCYQMTLQAGDLGVKSVESITLSASWISGTINLVAARPIKFMDTCQAQSGMALPIITCEMMGLVRLFDDSCLYLIDHANTSSSTNSNGVLHLAQG